MDEVKHTPGPWSYSEGEVTDLNGVVIAGNLYDSDRLARQDDANGRLMAAAPDLLAALKAHEVALAHVESWEPDRDPNRFRQVVDELYAQAEQLSADAIAKAEGK